ncbi:substrate-binding periplasmic protein [Oleidesulfovibrio sp.]|uniref:substrate-binding periplasmic protein n=1 Tax=Oleidesulfovibrio sp. TaxID=2909707 RepID=UPI003A8C0141
MRRAIFTLLLLLSVSVLPFQVRAQEPMTLICDIWPPYQTQKNGHVNGFSTLVVTTVLDNMKAPIKSTRAFPWQRALEIIRAGDAHILFSANYTPAREMFARYPSEPIVESPWVIWSRDKEFSRPEDLKGLRIGVVRGYSYTPEFWDFIETYCEVEQVHSDEINFKKLSIGRLDAIIAEYGNGLQIVRNLKVSNIRPLKHITIKSDGLYAIFSRKLVSEEFVVSFSRHLKEFKESEQYQKLYNSYFALEM